jgi:hypothetical protein
VVVFVVGIVCAGLYLADDARPGAIVLKAMPSLSAGLWFMYAACWIAYGGVLTKEDVIAPVLEGGAFFAYCVGDVIMELHGTAYLIVGTSSYAVGHIFMIAAACVFSKVL